MLQELFLKLVEWLLKLYKKWWPDPEPPVPTKAYQLVIRDGCRAAVRATPRLEAPTEWRLQENEVASLGEDIESVVADGYKFYHIVFGLKVGWVKYNMEDMYIREVAV